MPRGEKSRKLSDEQRAEVVRMYTTPNPDGTWTGAQTIARHFGVSLNAIQQRLKAEGIPLRSSKEAYANGKRVKPITRLPPKGELAPMCKCGCGNPVAWYQRKNRWYTYVAGHYRRDAPYKHRDWLVQQYVLQNRTVEDIASECGVTPGTVSHSMKAFGIPARDRSESRKGRKAGSKNPAWKGGVTPERQRLYKTGLWNETIKLVYKRDNYTCQRCGEPKKRQKGLHAHHIAPWAGNEMLRFEMSNLVTLCNDCHLWVHSRENVNGELLA